MYFEAIYMCARILSNVGYEESDLYDSIMLSALVKFLSDLKLTQYLTIAQGITYKKNIMLE